MMRMVSEEKDSVLTGLLVAALVFTAVKRSWALELYLDNALPFANSVQGGDSVRRLLRDSRHPSHGLTVGAFFGDELGRSS